MSGEKNTIFKSEVLQTREEVADFLRELAERITGGTLVLRRPGKELEVIVPDRVNLEIEVEDKHKAGKGWQRSLEIEIEWYEGGVTYGPVELG